MIGKAFVCVLVLGLVSIVGVPDAFAVCRYCDLKWRSCQEVECGNGKKICREVFLGYGQKDCYLEGGPCVVNCGKPPIYSEGGTDYAAWPSLTGNGQLASAWTPRTAERTFGAKGATCSTQPRIS